MNRRRFNEAVLAAGTAAVIGSHTQAAQNEPRSGEARAKLLAALVQERYGKFLNEEQMNAVRQRLQGQAASARQLAAIPLENGDEPDFAFSPDVLE
jgi:hypothetical protein